MDGCVWDGCEMGSGMCLGCWGGVTFEMSGYVSEGESGCMWDVSGLDWCVYDACQCGFWVCWSMSGWSGMFPTDLTKFPTSVDGIRLTALAMSMMSG